MGQPQMPQLKVLILEDNQVDRKMLQGMLARAPYGVFETSLATSLGEAKDLLREQSFDVILLDLNLEDSRGIETLQAVVAAYPDVAVVVNTGAYQDDLGLQAIMKGAQDYLLKGRYEAYGLSKSLRYAVERKRNERELKATYLRLQETQAQLIQAEKMSSIGALASGVAHEVKNPLATISYGIEFLQTKLRRPDPQVVLALQTIYDAAQSANNIIKELLDYAGLSGVERRPEDLHQIIEQSLNMVKHHCDKNLIIVRKDFAGSLPKVLVDKNRIEQVLVDVLLNAVGAMPQGGTLTVRTAQEKYQEGRHGHAGVQPVRFSPGDPVLIVDIMDTGDGIEEQHMGQIFEPFFTTRRGSGGIGLGLCIAQTIMINHGGVIGLRNQESGGVCVRLILGDAA